eukprot:TRINITY_DN2191_c0_g1_i3.p1 TRINITY_DN2191_c0_g1~~TRINITY_DN2191_c0_g1_i3.p1  ORF type:complete len:514 (-),score=63.93 TRINITY_DN2191_c0_g1_i3:55-1596(-)
MAVPKVIAAATGCILLTAVMFVALSPNQKIGSVGATNPETALVAMEPKTSPGGICTANSSCLSGFCLGGTCCMPPFDDQCSKCGNETINGAERPGVCTGCVEGYAVMPSQLANTCVKEQSTGEFCYDGSPPCAGNGACAANGVCCDPKVSHDCSQCNVLGECSAAAAPGTTCSSDTDCLSLNCQGGVCCGSFMDGNCTGCGNQDDLPGICTKCVEGFYALSPNDGSGCQPKVKVGEYCNGYSPGDAMCLSNNCSTNQNSCVPGHDIVSTPSPTPSPDARPPGGICTANSSCLSGFCLGGTCCMPPFDDQCSKCGNETINGAERPGVCTGCVEGYAVMPSQLANTCVKEQSTGEFCYDGSPPCAGNGACAANGVCCDPKVSHDCSQCNVLGECSAAAAPGTTCSSDTDCLSLNCQGGVCCRSFMDGNCTGCGNQDDLPGICTKCVEGFYALSPNDGSGCQPKVKVGEYCLSLIHISEPTRLLSISYAVFCLKKKKKTNDLKYDKGTRSNKITNI